MQWVWPQRHACPFSRHPRIAADGRIASQCPLLPVQLLQVELMLAPFWRKWNIWLALFPSHTFWILWFPAFAARAVHVQPLGSMFHWPWLRLPNRRPSTPLSGTKTWCFPPYFSCISCCLFQRPFLVEQAPITRLSTRQCLHVMDTWMNSKPNASTGDRVNWYENFEDGLVLGDGEPMKWKR